MTSDKGLSVPFPVSEIDGANGANNKCSQNEEFTFPSFYRLPGVHIVTRHVEKVIDFGSDTESK